MDMLITQNFGLPAPLRKTVWAVFKIQDGSVFSLPFPTRLTVFRTCLLLLTVRFECNTNYSQTTLVTVYNAKVYYYYYCGSIETEAYEQWHSQSLKMGGGFVVRYL
jgi:hypothetical protein